MDIREAAKKVHELAREKGWHQSTSPVVERLPLFLMNLHAEISELWESYRKGALQQPCDKAEGMKKLELEPLTCLEEELADIVIRAFDTAEAFGIDIERAILTKHAYNATRSHRHGGKLA